MDWGIENRLARILQPATGRTVMLAIDHGYFLGPTSGLEEPGKTVEPLLPHADSLMLTRGTLRQCIPAQANVPIVLRMSGGTSILRELSGEGLTVAVEDAIDEYRRLRQRYFGTRAYDFGERPLIEVGQGVARGGDLYPFAADKNFTFVGPVQSDQNIHKTAFTCSVFSQEGKDFTGIEL